MKQATFLIFLIGFSILGNSQNTCAEALTIEAGIHTVVVIDGSEIPSPICAPNGTGATASEWYKYIPSENYSIVLTTDLASNTGLDTRFHVYKGSCGSLLCHSGDDDSGSGFLSTATFIVEQGVEYLIAFDNRWSSTGFDFELQENPYTEPLPTPVTFTPANFPELDEIYQLAIADMNGDYLDDLVAVSSTAVQILYQQSSGTFVSNTFVTTSADFLPNWSIAIADFDKNGFSDLLYGGGSGVTFMQANETGTGYTEISGSEYVFSQRSNFVDINNDGHLDAFVCHDVQPNVYFLNDGEGNLVFHQGGLGDHPEGGNYGSIWVDYDNDGDSDLFIAKCRGGASTAKINELHRNDGNGIFVNVSIESNMADPVQTWSSAWNDYNNDGYMDALIGASSTADGTHKLMKNNGDATFSNITAGSGWDIFTGLSIEHVSYDFDNDGYADILTGNGIILYNQGDFTFPPTSYSFTSGAIGDLNDDGFLDIQNGNTVYFNNGNNNNWIKIYLQGIASNSNGIGARVEIYGDWGLQIRDVRCGEGFRFMNTLNVHFGIGIATEIDSMMVKWPSGKIDVIYYPTINESILVVEGMSPLSLVEIEGQKIQLFPNPANEIITIGNLNLIEVSKMSIFSNLGTEIMLLNDEESSFNISRLTPGLYVLIIQTKSGEKYSETFIKR